MSDVNRLIQQRIGAFTAELTALVRDAAVQAVTKALKPSAWQKRVAAAKSGKRRSKRSAAEVAITSQRLLVYVEKHPGKSVEAIAQALSVPTKALALRMHELVAAGTVTASGQKRATRYHPASTGRSQRTSKAKKRAARPPSRTAKTTRGSRRRSAKARRKR
jgi:hypothetical protein